LTGKMGAAAPGIPCRTIFMFINYWKSVASNETTCSLEFFEDGVRGRDFFSKKFLPRINHALRLLLQGVKLISIQKELIDNSMGAPELNVGSWVKMLERASGAKAINVGKPERYVFDLAIKSMGLARENVIMVGDRVKTDILGARLIQWGMLREFWEYDNHKVIICICEFCHREGLYFDKHHIYFIFFEDRRNIFSPGTGEIDIYLNWNKGAL